MQPKIKMESLCRIQVILIFMIHSQILKSSCNKISAASSKNTIRAVLLSNKYSTKISILKVMRWRN